MGEQKKKLWVIGRGIPSAKNGMKGSFELGQAKLFSEEYEVSYLSQVFTFSLSNATEGIGFRKGQKNGIAIFSRTVLYFPGRLKIHWKKYVDYEWRTFLKSVEKITGIPDIIHIHYPSMIGDSDVILAYKEKGTKIVCTEHWSHVLNKTLDYYEEEQLKRFVNESDYFVCVGEPLKKAVEDITKTYKEIKVIPNFYDIIFKPKPKTEKSYFEFVVIGRLVPVKQVDKVIDAFKKVADQIENVKLTIIGNGILYKQLLQQARDLNLEKKITFTGTLTTADVAEWLSKSDCLICYSNLETFGVPVIEAWACGIPVIASDALGFQEYWSDELGYIVDMNDTETLTYRMLEITAKKYESQKIVAFAHKHFSEVVVKDRIQALYRT